LFSRQPISLEATTSAGRAKKDRGKFWEGLGGYGSGLMDGLITPIPKEEKPAGLEIIGLRLGILAHQQA